MKLPFPDQSDAKTTILKSAFLLFPVGFLSVVSTYRWPHAWQVSGLTDKNTTKKQRPVSHSRTQCTPPIGGKDSTDSWIPLPHWLGQNLFFQTRMWAEPNLLRFLPWPNITWRPAPQAVFHTRSQEDCIPVFYCRVQYAFGSQNFTSSVEKFLPTISPFCRSECNLY